MVREAKRAGMQVTCDVSIHHVHLSEMDIGYFDSNCNLVPPLRSLRDRDASARGLADGTIDAICSDHTPVDDDAKQLPFAEAEPGATGLELLLPLTLKWAREAAHPAAAGAGEGDHRAAASARARSAARSRPGSRPICACSIPRLAGKSSPALCRARARTRRFSGCELQGRCATRWSMAQSCTTRRLKNARRSPPPRARSASYSQRPD